MLIEEEADLGDHRLRREGLHHVVDGTLGVALDDLLLFAADGGDEDDRRVARALPLADERGSLESVEVRHLYVEEDEGAVFGEQEPQRLAAGARLDEPLSERFEHRFEREQIRFAIVDDEDGLGSLRLGRICHRACQHNRAQGRAVEILTSFRRAALRAAGQAAPGQSAP